MNTTLNELINSRVIPHVAYLFQKVTDEKENVTIDGVKGLNSEDFFVPGKMVNVFSYLLLSLKRDSEEYRRSVEHFCEIIDFVTKYEIQTWGIFQFLTGLERLQRYGIMADIISSDNLRILQQKLDWRHFVNPDDLSLINLPTNYYGCAFGVARLRELLGWEDENASWYLLEKLTEHVKNYSGGYLYSDETPGEGRFDRYSILLPGEICTRLIDTQMEVPKLYLQMLRRSCDIDMEMINTKGNGFAYGRTIGAYGDTSLLEVLSVAAYLNVLTEEEKETAYTFCKLITEKFVNFWLDPEMKSVNLWEKGRKDDDYRGKFRILGENLSLSYQHIHSNELWNKAGFKDRPPLSKDQFEVRLDRLPKHYFVMFSHSQYDRGLTIIRDGQYQISLPLINGGSHFYQCSPYFPVPHAIGMLAGSPGEFRPHLIPQLCLEDGSVVMPLTYIKNIEAVEDGDIYTVKYVQDELCLMGENSPRPEKRLKDLVTYQFRPGEICREDIIIPVVPIPVREIVMEFASYSEMPTIKGNEVLFGNGSVYSFSVSGLELERIESVEHNSAYHTPHGALKNRIAYRAGNLRNDEPLCIRWILKYR